MAVGDSIAESGPFYFNDDNGKNWTVSATQFPDLHRLNKSKTKFWIAGKEELINDQMEKNKKRLG